VTPLAATTSPVALAFDRLASDYDSIFTFSAIGKSQRDVVWKHLLSAFVPGSHVLELNCGTGQDALFMARAGLTVTACDTSSRMIEQARMRMAMEDPEADIDFITLPTEEIDRFPQTCRFDALFSNFAGLNCVSDLSNVMRHAARRLKPGAPLLLCLSTRYCLWEILFFLLRGNLRKALRRCGGVSEAQLAQLRFPVYYPTLSQLRRVFAPELHLVSVVGVGITVPPSYLESWIARHPRLLRRMEALDELVRTWPGLRIAGDHMLLHLEKVHP
jgi:ubiquinone/menaquinone biosynthesis C-methylase UbiE